MILFSTTALSTLYSDEFWIYNASLNLPSEIHTATPISTWKYDSHLKLNNAKSNLIFTWTLPPN